AILILTGGGPADATNILPVYLFDVSFQYFKLGRGAAIAFTLLVVTIILGMLLVKVFEDPRQKQAGAGGVEEDGHGVARAGRLPHTDRSHRRRRDRAFPGVLRGLDGTADLHHVHVVFQGPAGGVPTAGGGRLGGRRGVLPVQADLPPLREPVRR